MSAIAQIIAALGGDTATAAYRNVGGASSFTVPAGVTAISMLCVSGGGGGNDIQGGGGHGGGGGGVSYTNNVAVTPGEVLTINVGSGGTRGIWSGSGNPGVAGAGGATSIKRGATVLVEASGAAGAYSMGGVGGNFSGTGTGNVKLVGGTGGNASGSEYRGGQGGGVGSLVTGTSGTNGATATVDYRGGGDGNGFLLDTSTIDYCYILGGTVNSSDRHGTVPNSSYQGAGGGGGAYGDAGYTLAGLGASGSAGLAILIWGGRTFSSNSSF